MLLSFILKDSDYKLAQFREDRIQATLLDDYAYPERRMELEYPVSFGREKKRADIVIFDKDQTTTPYIIVELKNVVNYIYE